MAEQFLSCDKTHCLTLERLLRWENVMICTLAGSILITLPPNCTDKSSPFEQERNQVDNSSVKAGVCRLWTQMHDLSTWGQCWMKLDGHEEMTVAHYLHLIMMHDFSFFVLFLFLTLISSTNYHDPVLSRGFDSWRYYLCKTKPGSEYPVLYADLTVHFCRQLLQHQRGGRGGVYK